ncbi:PPOX class F420-dependent oxidoreductase [Herbiconiux sp.]|uniref:PPOX class F420-dependent oxidoreductase n=1 Tax=Herbiconiux sp. TaxID=1871186 RepID=UPI0025BDE6B0|nr:PPOX class F420-dependent oxidoreductase [Herbiconiux sp.]
MASWESTRPYFERAAVAHVATLMPDGSPHSVPVWVGVEGDELAIFMVSGSRKDRNLQRDPRLAISVTRPDEPLDMATVRGVAVRRIDGAEAMPIVDRIAQKYTGGPYELRDGLTVFLVRPDTSWSNDYTA